MTMKDYAEAQLQEVLGKENKDSFFKEHGRMHVDNTELWVHWINTGKAGEFHLKHWKEYCSEDTESSSDTV